MDLSENRTQHPNLIHSVTPESCTIGPNQYRESVIIPSNGDVKTCTVSNVEHLTESIIDDLCQYDPEVIILSTGNEIIFPDTLILDRLVKQNIGLEVLTNQAAARTFNVLLSENRQTVCLMIL